VALLSGASGSEIWSWEPKKSDKTRFVAASFHVDRAAKVVYVGGFASAATTATAEPAAPTSLVVHRIALTDGAAAQPKGSPASVQMPLEGASALAAAAPFAFFRVAGDDSDARGNGVALVVSGSVHLMDADSGVVSLAPFEKGGKATAIADISLPTTTEVTKREATLVAVSLDNGSAIVRPVERFTKKGKKGKKGTKASADEVHLRFSTDAAATLTVAGGALDCFAAASTKQGWGLVVGASQGAEGPSFTSFATIDGPGRQLKADKDSRIPTSDDSGPVSTCFASAFGSKDASGSRTYRSLVVMDDHSVSMYQGTVTSEGAIAKPAFLWQRQEALATVSQVGYVQARSMGAGAASDDQGRIHELGGFIETLVERLAEQRADVVAAAQSTVDAGLKAVAKISANGIRSIMGTPTGAAGKFSFEAMALERDAVSEADQIADLDQTLEIFGLRKVMVLLSEEAGKVIAVRTDRPKVLWSRSFGAGTSASGTAMQLIVTRARLKGTAPPEVLVVRGRDLFWLDAWTGHTLHQESLPYTPVQTLLAPATAATAEGGRRPVMAVDEALGDIRLLPAASAESVEARKAMSAGGFYHRVDRAKGTITGYRVGRSGGTGGGKAGGKAGGHVGKVMWTVVFPTDRENIVSYAGEPHGEKTHAAAESLGDDSLLLKYLNPHMLVVITASGDRVAAGAAREGERGLTATGAGASKAGKKAGEKEAPKTITVHLIDSVSGDIVHRTTHSNAAGPISSVRSENWVFYSYWNTKARRVEMASMALYEGAVGKYKLNPWSTFSMDDEDSSAAASSAGANALENTEFSSFSADPDPIVLHRSFVFPAGVRAMAVTQSQRGITNKNILVGLLSGQVLSLDRRFLDPRRPDTPPNPSEQKEGLMQYSPFMPVMPMAMVSYNKVRSERGARARVGC
jgi:hypothetical protein